MVFNVGIGMHAGIPTLTLYLSVVWDFIFKKITVLNFFDDDTSYDE